MGAAAAATVAGGLYPKAATILYLALFRAARFAVIVGLILFAALCILNLLSDRVKPDATDEEQLKEIRAETEAEAELRDLEKAPRSAGNSEERKDERRCQRQ